MFKIGYRTIKTALGTTLAIVFAQILGLDNFASAGIITILCIKATKKKSVQASVSRIIACLIAMGYSTCFLRFLVTMQLQLDLFFYFLFLLPLN